MFDKCFLCDLCGRLVTEGDSESLFNFCEICLSIYPSPESQIPPKPPEYFCPDCKAKMKYKEISHGYFEPPELHVWCENYGWSC